MNDLVSATIIAFAILLSVISGMKMERSDKVERIKNGKLIVIDKSIYQCKMVKILKEE